MVIEKILAVVIGLAIVIPILINIIGMLGELFSATRHVVRGEKPSSYYDDTSNPHGMV